MTQATIYHNPRCSKSRKTLQILQDQGISIHEIRYLETPPTRDELGALCQAMAIEPQQLIRTGESLFKELGLSITDPKSRIEWLSILVDNPKLIERPIVRVCEQVVIGRPPEKVLSIL
ncbi:arsenate reductase (glutaredoxin) [Hydrogenovibrio sp. SC-1]|uniref:arsenate reductase (glutaredoxin) n=1 Tax=Hydrogenovibrio sp. SC-1 TaxID=2065820 RepID=UPI000C7D4E94|nr:arsenate reductase (glutaredoxin) [Hydrogenovibrio sp. SC-1]PLA73501.1 arsenate reductase (glutaredoxin) [Hydrogenovibrio sp. SC-1]